jgi:hypothetical protein
VTLSSASTNLHLPIASPESFFRAGKP